LCPAARRLRRGWRRVRPVRRVGRIRWIAPVVVSDREADAEAHECSARDVARWIDGRRWIGRVGPGAVDDGRAVDRDVDDLGIGRLDPDDRGRGARPGVGSAGERLDLHRLLRRRLEVAGVERALPELLDGEEDAVAVLLVGLAELLGPILVLGHHGQDVREGGHRLHWWIPLLVGERRLEVLALEAGVGLAPLRSLEDLVGPGRRLEELTEEGIGEERDGREQRLELLCFASSLPAGGRRSA
jgi:hypothetical protein